MILHLEYTEEYKHSLTHIILWSSISERINIEYNTCLLPTQKPFLET